MTGTRAARTNDLRQACPGLDVSFAGLAMQVQHNIPTFQLYQGTLMIFQRIRAFLLPLLFALPLCATAGPFSSIFVFGDSLSDTGNLINTGTVPPYPLAGPYAGGRFSTGPLWVEHLANGLGLSGQADPFTTGGHNFAFAGATTGGFPPASPLEIPSLLTQSLGIFGGIGSATPLQSVDPNALYVVVAGGNDMRDARSAVGADGASLAAAAANAANNIATTLSFLASKGAKNVLIANLPDLGRTPEASLMQLNSLSTMSSNAFNAMVPGLMGFGTNVLNLHMSLLDIAAVTDEIFANPASLGITNTTAPCTGFALSVEMGGTSCDKSAFADVLHPTGQVHARIGAEALELFGIPEPESLALFAVALIALSQARRRQPR